MIARHGGKRSGAGRPKGSGAKYQEETQVVRIPKSLRENIAAFLEHKGYQLPLYSNKVSAGFPSPADDHIEAELDLTTHLIKNPAATFLVRVSGESMKGVGIFPGDILVVDRSLNPSDGRIVIAVLDGELTVKRLKKGKEAIYLMPENPDFSPIQVNEMQDLNIWGVVTNVIHAL